MTSSLLPRLLGSSVLLLALLSAISAHAQSVQVRFKNNTAGQVGLFWLDANNNNVETKLGDLASQGEGGTTANLGDTWVVRDANGEQLLRVKITRAERFQINPLTPIVGTHAFTVTQAEASTVVKISAAGMPSLHGESLLFASQVRSKAPLANDSVLPVPFQLMGTGNPMIPQLTDWSIHVDSTTLIPKDAQFNILVATPDIAFRHKNQGNRTKISYFDHPLVNGNDEVICFVNRVYVFGSGPTHPLGIHWDDATKRWGVLYTDGAEIEPGATFNVLVMPLDVRKVVGLNAMMSDWTTAEELNPVANPPGAFRLNFPNMTPQDLIFATFDGAPAGMAIDEAVPNPHDPLITRAADNWHISNSDGRALPGKARFVLLFVTPGAAPTPGPLPGNRQSVRVVNATRKVITVAIDTNPPVDDFVDPQSTQTFDNIPTGSRVVVRGGANDPTINEVVGAGPLTINYPAGSGPPVVRGYTATIVNNSAEQITFLTRTPGAADFVEVARLNARTAQAFPNLPDGTSLRVVGRLFARAGQIRGADERIEVGPPQAGYTLTVRNQTNGQVLVSTKAPGAADYVALATLDGGAVQRFPNQPDGTLVQVAGRFSVSRSTIQGADREVVIGGTPDPVPVNPGYTLTVVNATQFDALVYTHLAPATNWTQIGTVRAGQRGVFANQPNNTNVHVTQGPTLPPETGRIAGGDLTMNLGGGLPPPPPNQGYVLTVVNRAGAAVTVSTSPPGGFNFTPLATLQPGQTQSFPNLPDRTRFQITGAGLRNAGSIASADRTITVGGVDPNPFPANAYTLTVINSTNARAIVYAFTPGGANWTEIGRVAGGQADTFPNLPDGAEIHITTNVAIGPTSGRISGRDLTLTVGGGRPNPNPNPNPNPIAGGYRVTVTMDRLEVVNGGDGLDDPGDLYWDINVVQRSPVGVGTQKLSERRRNESFPVVSGRSYSWRQLDRAGGSLTFDAAPGTSIEINGSIDEYDDFLRGGDDHMGDFNDAIQVPGNGLPLQRTFRRELVENVPNGGRMTVSYTITCTPN